MSKYVDRPVTFLQLPLTEKSALLHVEHIVVMYEKGLSVDVGRLCYSDTEKGIRRRAKGVRVALCSFQSSRVTAIRRLINYLSDRVARQEFRPLTDHTHGRRAVEFVEWSYGQGFSEVLTSKDEAENAFINFAIHLREKIRPGSLNQNTAGPMQSETLTFCINYYRDSDFGRGVRQIETGRRFATPTDLPDEESISRALALCFTFFSELTNLVLHNLPFPYVLRMPPYLSLPNNQLWYFPGRKPFLTSVDRLKLEAGNPPKKWRPLDFENGVLANVEDIVAYYPRRKSTPSGSGRETLDYRTARNSIERAKKMLDEANKNSNDVNRIEAAMKAHNAFVVLFAADTGMNESGIRDCPWRDDFTISKSRPNFRLIKFRASKEVSFELSTKFLPYFRRYLELRAYALNGRACETLFFTFGTPTHKVREPYKMGFRPLCRAYDLLTKLDPLLKRVLTRQWRIHSVDFYIRHADVRTAALILQNDEDTVKKYYSAGSETTAALELTNFFSRVKAQVTATRAEESTVLGGKLVGCEAPGNPAPIDGAFPIAPNCHELGGCLFCDKFSVHSDEKDTRKLLSCKHVINRGMHLSENRGDFQRLFGEVLNRIDLIVDEISKTSVNAEAMTRRVAFEVEEDGMLDPHFQLKIDQLIELGVISRNSQPLNKRHQHKDSDDDALKIRAKIPD